MNPEFKEIFGEVVAEGGFFRENKQYELYLHGGKLQVRKVEEVKLGGYASEQKYGSPKYCPSATRWHKRRFAELEHYPQLVFFSSVTVAVSCNFSPCGNCWLVGDKKTERWLEYVHVCKEFGKTPITSGKK